MDFIAPTSPPKAEWGREWGKFTVWLCGKITYEKICRWAQYFIIVWLPFVKYDIKK